MRAEDQAAQVYFEPEMWVALEGAQVAHRVTDVDRQGGLVTLQTPDGPVIVPASDALRGLLLLHVAKEAVR